MSMNDRERLSALIGDIYNAALDPGQRTDGLEKIASFIGGHPGESLSEHPLHNFENLQCYMWSEPDSLQVHPDSYSALDSGSQSSMTEHATSATDPMPCKELRQGRLYREWVQSNGWVEVASVVIEKSPIGSTYLGVARHEASALVDDELRRRLALILPHVRRAYLIGKTTHLARAETACFRDILDVFSPGVILIGAGGIIVHTNAAGNAVLAAADFLRAVGGRLVAADVQLNEILRDVVIASDVGGSPIGVKGFALPLTAQNGERYVAHMMPLTSDRRRGVGHAFNAVAALFVRKVALEAFSSTEIIGRIYKLTPTELRVLHAIVDIGGVPEVAAALGVAVTTIKTHLSRLFEKTGVGRQADLVKLVAGFSMPLAS
jgi:DNA-binding CsgD family transcriptional regulator